MSEKKSYDSLLTMAALNMAVVSLHRITSTKDRLILDQEYKNIINNLRMGEINADPELTELYQEIVRVINSGRLRDEIREEIESGYDEEKQKSIKEIIKKNIFSSFDFNPLKWLGNLAASTASEYFGSNENDADEKRKLKSEELSEYDELQRKLLASSWKLLRQYELSDNYRLTQSALEKFHSATHESNTSRRLRMLKYIEGDFKMYSPYWFYRAKAANEANDQSEAEKSFAKFNEVWRPVLRKDPYKVEALKFQIEELIQGGLTEENAEKILEKLSEMRENTPIEDWANNIYEGTLFFTLGKKEEAIECVDRNILFRYETDNSQMLIERFERKVSLEKIPEPSEEVTVISKPENFEEKTREEIRPLVTKEKSNSSKFIIRIITFITWMLIVVITLVTFNK